MRDIQVQPPADNKIVCPEGCAVWIGKKGRPWWIYSGGIGSCVACIIYEINCATPEIYFYHFMASGKDLLDDFGANMPPSVQQGKQNFRVALYYNPDTAHEGTHSRIYDLELRLNGVDRITTYKTNGGFNVNLGNGTFTDGNAGGGVSSTLESESDGNHVITEFSRLQDNGDQQDVDVAKSIPDQWNSNASNLSNSSLGNSKPGRKLSL